MLVPNVLYSSNICEILLYNRHLVVITHELIYGVWAAYRQGKNYCETGLLWTVNCLNQLSEVSTDTCPLPSAILNLMNPSLGLVSWFHESGFGFRKSGLNKRNKLVSILVKSNRAYDG